LRTRLQDVEDVLKQDGVQEINRQTWAQEMVAIEKEIAELEKIAYLIN
jgi:hypothetical protein